MILQGVTITGADDHTYIEELMNLSAKFPFVEWGILMSPKRVGTNRFPSGHWMKLFARAVSYTIALRIPDHAGGILVMPP